MSLVPLDTSAERVFALIDELDAFVEFARAHEKWEAEALLSDGPWFDMMPEELYDEFMRVQALRNKALGRGGR